MRHPLSIRDVPADQASPQSTVSIAVFDAAYHRGVAMWDIPGPQPSFVWLAEEGRIGGRVLDVGSGTGEIALYLAARGHHVVGVDASRRALSRARRKAEERGIEVEFVRANVLELSLPEQFDTAVDCGCFHTLSDADRAPFAASLRRALVVGGTFFVQCANEHATITGPRRVTQDEIRSTFADGWDVRSIESFPLQLVPGKTGGAAWLAEITRH
jgi:SAM-dependent methyltransferase